MLKRCLKKIFLVFLLIIFFQCNNPDSDSNNNSSKTKKTDIQTTNKENEEKEQTNNEQNNQLQTVNTEKVQLQIWFHSQLSDTGKAVTKLINDFNNIQNSIFVEIIYLPEGNYKEFVLAKAEKGELPDILDIDGPDLANYVWRGYIRSLDNLVNQELLSDLLPSIIKQGTINDSLYTIGQFDSGLALAGNKSYLKKAGIRIPKTVDDAWNYEEFVQVIETLKNLEELKYSWDIKLHHGSPEFLPYTLSPFVQNYGGGLIDRKDYSHSDGILNGAGTRKAMQDLQKWVKNGYIVPEDGNPSSFEDKESGLSIFGHWMYRSYKEKLGDDLVIIPMPKIKNQTTGMGSYCWGITTKCKDAKSAWEFLSYLFKPENILFVAKANGSIPASQKALSDSMLHKEGGPLYVFVDQLKKIALPRPKTPAYPFISQQFRLAVKNIVNGADVQEQLDNAVQKIDTFIEKNNYYK